MKGLKGFSSFILIFISMGINFSCTSLDRKARIISKTGLQDGKEGQRLSQAKNDIILAKQLLKLAIIQINFMEKEELVDNSGEKKAVFIEAKAFSPILFKEQVSPLQLFNGEPVFTKLMPEFYQFLSTLEQKRIPLVVECSSTNDCLSLREDLKRKYNLLKVVSLEDLVETNTKVSYIVMLSSRNIALSKNISSQFRTAFKYNWLNFPKLYAQDLNREEWASLIAKVKEF